MYLFSRGRQGMYTMLVFGDIGAVYRQVHLKHFMSNGMGRGNSVRLHINTPISSTKPVCVYQDGQLLCVLETVGMEQEEKTTEHVCIPTLFSHVSVVDVWEESNHRDIVPYAPARIENICGKLDSQDVTHVCRSAVVRPIKKCFGRKFAMYGLHGNITFDGGGLCIPQFRAVRDLDKFKKQLRILRLEEDNMSVHLIVVCMSLGRQVSVNQNSTLVRFLSANSAFTFMGCLDEQNNNLSFKYHGKYLKMNTSVSITRRGCLLVHVAWDRSVCVLDDTLIQDVLEHANSILQCVSSLC